jgi:cysteine synthase A
MAEVLPALSQGVITPTRLLRAVVRYAGYSSRIGLKLERDNVTGSLKDRTAAGLITALIHKKPLAEGDVVIESTSGNLGLAMAAILEKLKCQFIAVVDPKTPAHTRRAIDDRGARTVLVDDPDPTGGYLLSRIARVRDICRENPGYHWPDQYCNPANPDIHARTTGPEIVRQAGPTLDAVYVAVSTGGTLAGVSAYVRALRAAVRIVAVDACGSRAIVDSPGRRSIPGIGASRRSSFVEPGAYDDVRHVADADAFAVCHILREDLGLCLGGSSGSVVCAMIEDLPRRPGRFPVCLCPDGGEKYLDTFYDRGWLAGQGADAAFDRAVDRFRARGLSFRPEG